jgi:hypothetical protein
VVYSEEHERLLGLLDRATSQMGVALGEAKQANDELTTLLAVVQQRRLSRSERLRYRRVERAEKNAVKHYLAARHWHESVAARLRDLRFRDDEVAGPAA